MVKIKLDVLKTLLDKAIETSRLRMEYASREVVSCKPALFRRARKQVPLHDSSDYWPYMMKVHPWNELEGFYNTWSIRDKLVSDEIEISMKLASYLVIRQGNK